MAKKNHNADANATAQENEVSIDFGERKVNSQNFSKTVVLPKTALTGCGCNLHDDIRVNVKLLTKGKERVILLTPVCGIQQQEEEEVE